MATQHFQLSCTINTNSYSCNATFYISCVGVHPCVTPVMVTPIVVYTCILHINTVICFSSCVFGKTYIEEKNNIV